MSEDDLAKMSWTSFAESVEESTMPELIRYLKERRIYINEAVDVEEEV